jgi:hypothetical protein
MRKEYLRMRNIAVLAALLAPLLAVYSGLAQSQPELYLAASGRAPTGPVYDGFALSLTSSGAPIQLGSPIWVTVELRNVSGQMQGALFGPRYYGYAFAIVDRSDGSAVSRNPNAVFGLDSMSGPANGHPISAGTSLYGKFRLDLLYNFTKPGVYTVQVIKGVPKLNGKWSALESNSITIVVSR